MHLRGMVSDWVRRRQSFSIARIFYCLTWLFILLLWGRLLVMGLVHEQVDSELVVRVVLDRVVALGWLASS